MREKKVHIVKGKTYYIETSIYTFVFIHTVCATLY